MKITIRMLVIRILRLIIFVGTMCLLISAIWGLRDASLIDDLVLKEAVRQRHVR